MRQRRLYLHNALAIRVFLEIFDEGANDFTPFEGVATARFSATPNGAALGGAVDIVLAPTEEPGIYNGAISAANVDAVFAAYAGKAVYQIVTSGPANELHMVTTWLVTDPRFVP